MNHPGQTVAAVLDPLAFLSGGGEMGRLIGAMDWSKTTLGPVADWPQSLRTTVSICLASDLPICVIWGPGLVQIYNDAYRVICGDKHPQSMGQNFPECWQEAWPVIGQAHDSALAGDTAFLESQHIYLKRHGYVEECFFTFSFSPIRDEAGQVGGLFHPVIEVTAKMLAERRTRALRDLTLHTSQAKSVAQSLALASESLASYELDLPFTLLYTLSADGHPAQLARSRGLKEDALAKLQTATAAGDPSAILPLTRVQQTRLAVQVNGLRQLGSAVAGPDADPADAALLLPIIRPGTDELVAILVAGISARLPMNEAYRSFYDLIASGISTAIGNADAFDDQRRQAHALAELDRAKTVFFSNVSHEFRTPLTLMLGPLEDALAASSEPLPPLQRERLALVHRNGLRLQRLVNSLLDFSRIEAGRVRAVYEPTGLADFTADLASNFRSACDKAGLTLRVDCPPIGEPVFVDRPMWEKIVLNLLSNAFKFTFDGAITVMMRQADGAAELRVQDTGTGIPAEEIPLLFNRFHRVENARGRTHEGSGIGLALVQELVKLHGGTISVTSEVGYGTTFIVSIPLGAQHLPRQQVGSSRAAAQPTAEATPFVDEVLRWLPDADQHPALGSVEPLQRHVTADAAPPQQLDDDRPLVLVADDNADMRQYIVRLLGQLYRTVAVPDGEAALAAVRVQLPDLVLTDVMMPRQGGFGLLNALRADPRTSGVPVIMLSARAGEESRIEGMEQGADDYLVKPFSARELLARVTAHLQMAQMRREASAAIEASEEQFRALVNASSDVVYRMNADWTEMRHLQGREFIADTHEPNSSWLVRYIPPQDQPHVLEVIEAAILSKGVFELEHRVLRVDGSIGWTFSRAVPMLDSHGHIKEWFGAARDVTTRKLEQATLRQLEGRSQVILESITDGFYALDSDWRFTYMNSAGERFLGRPPGDLIGKCVFEEFPGAVGSEVDRVYRRVVAGRVAESFTFHYPDFDRWYTATVYPAPDGLTVYFRDVTDRTQVEQERQQFVALVDASSDFIGVAGLDQRGVYINPAGEALIGLEPGQVSSISILDIFPESERDRIVSLIADAKDGEQVVVDTWFQHLQSGRLIPVSWSHLILRDASGNVSGYATVTRDLTERNKAESLLRLSEERRRLALDAAELGMWHVDTETRITDTDARFRTIFGATEVWTDYMQAVAVIHPDDQPAVMEAVAAATRLEDPAPYAIEYRIIHPDGSVRWIMANGRVSFGGIGPTRRVTSFDGTVADITDRKRSEVERDQLLSRLQDQDLHKDVFLATLAHELRNPLAPIRNGLKVMRLTPGDAQATEQVRSMVERQVEQMVHLIDDLMDLSRISRGKIELRKERIELAGVIAQAIETSRTFIDQAGHELIVEVPASPIYIDADLTRLTQVFSNLLNNAAKFTNASGQLRLVVQLVGAEVVVSITDNGIGIPTHMLEQVFEMFTQVQSNLERSQGGVGIGLSIVQRLVQMHGGSTEARSEGPGMGSEFVVRLPVVSSPDGQQLVDNRNTSCPTTRLRIVVADDNVDSAEILAMLLTLKGYDTRTAHDGEAALDLAAPFMPDVMLLDIGMPRLNGYEVCQRIRQQAWGKSTLVIAMTGWGQEDDRRKSREAGFDFHLVKPVDLDVLDKLLAAVTAKAALKSMQVKELLDAFGRNATGHAHKFEPAPAPEPKHAPGQLEQLTAESPQLHKFDASGQLIDAIAHDLNNLLQIISADLHLMMKQGATSGDVEMRVSNTQAAVKRGAKLTNQLLKISQSQGFKP